MWDKQGGGVVNKNVWVRLTLRIRIYQYANTVSKIRCLLKFGGPMPPEPTIGPPLGTN